MDQQTIAETESDRRRRNLEKARATLARNRAERRAAADAVAAATAAALHDPTGEAVAQAAHEPEAPCLDPTIAYDTPAVEAASGESALVLAARRMLECAAVRRGDGVVMDDRCQLCEDTGIHHGTPIRCSCGCHLMREALACPS